MDKIEPFFRNAKSTRTKYFQMKNHSIIERILKNSKADLFEFHLHYISQTDFLIYFFVFLVCFFFGSVSWSSSQFFLLLLLLYCGFALLITLLCYSHNLTILVFKKKKFKIEIHTYLVRKS